MADPKQKLDVPLDQLAAMNTDVEHIIEKLTPAESCIGSTAWAACHALLTVLTGTLATVTCTAGQVATFGAGAFQCVALALATEGFARKTGDRLKDVHDACTR